MDFLGRAVAPVIAAQARSRTRSATRRATAGRLSQRACAARASISGAKACARAALRTAETLAALGEPPQPQLVGDAPDPTLVPEPIVTSIQRKLRGYSREMNPGARPNGRVSGRWNDRIESAVRIFQELCNLPVTGLPDQATLERMDLGVEERHPRNLAEYWVKHGCDVALGFTLSIATDHASAWGQRFWRHAKEGMGVSEAAQALSRAAAEARILELSRGRGVEKLDISEVPLDRATRAVSVWSGYVWQEGGAAGLMREMVSIDADTGELFRDPSPS